MSPAAVHILLVEDESIVAEDIAEILQEGGYAIAATAADAETAVRLFNSTAPDIVLMDIQLRGATDGITAVGQMLAIRQVPVIYLTAQSDAATVARARATRPAAYLLKPFDERGLLIAIDIALDHFSSRQVAAHPVLESAAAGMQQKAARERLNADTILRLEDSLFIKQGYKFVKINQDHFLYIEADGSHSHIHTIGNKITLRLSLSQVIEKLADRQVVRVHRSYAVNRTAVEAFTDHELTIRKQTIPMSDAYKDAFLSGFNIF